MAAVIVTRRRCLLAVAASLMAAALPCAAATSLETAVKATYLYKFAPFVGWPAGHDATNSAPFHICVVGADPFQGVLDQAVSGQAYGARPFQISRLTAIDAQSGCDIAYIGGSADQGVAAALSAVHGAPVLTVTDAGSPAGIVQFTIQDGRVRFFIDQDQAAAGGLSISSKLLSLAVSVKGGRP